MYGFKMAKNRHSESGRKHYPRRAGELVVCAAAIGVIAYASVASGHHSFGAVFDRDQPIELTGTVTDVQWKNPHVWFFVDVESESGNSEKWAFEMGSPNALIRRGWTHKSLQVGHQITIRGARARDGSQRGAALSITLASGESLFGAQSPPR